MDKLGNRKVGRSVTGELRIGSGRMVTNTQYPHSTIADTLTV